MEVSSRFRRGGFLLIVGGSVEVVEEGGESGSVVRWSKCMRKLGGRGRLEGLVLLR